MKIKNISCTQFAGIRDKNISLEDGINIIYGKNESGKSTLVNLLSRTLFQNAKIDGRSDREFRSLYFPTAKKGSSVSGDFLDGKISLETENGTYTLSKEWGSDSRCMLSTPDGVIRDQKKINEILKDVLVYGEGVYTDMLLSSQRNSDTSLQTLLDASQKTDAKQEIINAATVAFAESDGISIDAVGEGIAEKIKEISGLHWDFEHGVPMKKSGSGKWASGLGEIHKAYYEWEEAKSRLDEISALESAMDSACERYSLKDADAVKAEREFEKFNTFASRLTIQSERRSRIKTMEADIQKYKEILEKWPELAKELSKAQELQNEKEQRGVLDKYAAVKKLSDDVESCEKEIEKAVSPSENEILDAKQAQRNISALENKLCGMNIAAHIRMIGDNTVQVKSLRTGELLDINDEKASINEAVSIVIPNVAEMTLSPANTDVDEVNSSIKLYKDRLEAVYEKYGAKSIEELEKQAAAYAAAVVKRDSAQSRLELALNGSNFEALEAVAVGITVAVREMSEIEEDIFALCKSEDIARFITVREALIEKNQADYGSEEELKEKLSSLTLETEKMRASLGSGEDIPTDYLKISDPEAHLEALRHELDVRRKAREDALTAKTEASSKLELYKEKLDGDASENAANAERKFNEQKELLSHWKHIEEVFRAKKNELSLNPMQDISESFARYLGIISSGKVSSEFPEQDKLDMNIYSDNRLLDYGKLSEGTKETVSLSFRLAALDHLFPDGGGVVVLDDPFTDMDAERTEQACELIKTFAKKHQVIFLTCKEEYIDMLQGNLIKM